MLKKNDPAKRVKDLGKDIAKEIEHWQHLKEYGGSDPNWEDGVNMNLTRNHIIHAKHEIEQKCDENGIEYPAEYQLETPPEVPQGYMARPDGIREDAKKALAIYEKDKNYLWLLDHGAGLSERDKENTCYKNVVGYAKWLREAIDKDDLLYMRLHRDPEWRIESFQRCRQKVEQIEQAKAKTKPAELPTGQLSIFDLFGVAL